jgi:ribosomal-protein-serine acetyltransferase
MGKTIRAKSLNDSVGIRRYRADDIPLVFEAVRESIKEISPWMSWCHPGYSLGDSSAWVLSREEAWNNKTEYSFVIIDQKTGTLLGSVGLNFINTVHWFANLGYWVRSSQAGRGVATAATLLAARFGFEDLGLHRIEIIAAVENTASQRVAEKAGAQREGVLRNRLLIGERPHDAVIFSLIAKDLNI